MDSLPELQIQNSMKKAYWKIHDCENRNTRNDILLSQQFHSMKNQEKASQLFHDEKRMELSALIISETSISKLFHHLMKFKPNEIIIETQKL